MADATGSTPVIRLYTVEQMHALRAEKVQQKSQKIWKNMKNSEKYTKIGLPEDSKIGKTQKS